MQVWTQISTEEDKTLKVICLFPTEETNRKKIKKQTVSNINWHDRWHETKVADPRRAVIKINENENQHLFSGACNFIAATQRSSDVCMAFTCLHTLPTTSEQVQRVVFSGTSFQTWIGTSHASSNHHWHATFWRYVWSVHGQEENPQKICTVNPVTTPNNSASPYSYMQRTVRYTLTETQAKEYYQCVPDVLLNSQQTGACTPPRTHLSSIYSLHSAVGLTMWSSFTMHTLPFAHTK